MILNLKRSFNMKTRITATLLTVILLTGLVPTQALTIKLGSLAPNGSPWDLGLRKIAAKWSSISKGKIKLKIYPGGIAGDEEDMIRKMRINQLNAAGLTGVGMCRIFSGILAVQLPLLIRDDAELNYVLEKITPVFEKQLEEKGFKVLVWTKVGWIHFFSKNPVITPGDLKKHKLFIYAGDPDGVQAWKREGFNPVPLSPNDVMSSLQTGMVNAFSTTPLTAASQQWFGLTKNMCGMNWAPFIGGIVVEMKTWKKIPASLQQKLLVATHKIGIELQNDIDKADAQAIDIMKNNGLVINPVPEKTVQEWTVLAEKGYNSVVGKSFDAKSFDEIKKLINEYRAQNK